MQNAPTAPFGPPDADVRRDVRRGAPAGDQPVSARRLTPQRRAVNASAGKEATLGKSAGTLRMRISSVFIKQSFSE